MLLKGYFGLRSAVEFIDKIAQTISAQITVPKWSTSAHEEQNLRKPVLRGDGDSTQTDRGVGSGAAIERA